VLVTLDHDTDAISWERRNGQLPAPILLGRAVLNGRAATFPCWTRAIEIRTTAPKAKP
jgi:hypothetical protein